MDNQNLDLVVDPLNRVELEDQMHFLQIIVSKIQVELAELLEHLLMEQEEMDLLRQPPTMEPVVAVVEVLGLLLEHLADLELQGVQEQY
jgi:hypothetical protein